MAGGRCGSSALDIVVLMAMEEGGGERSGRRSETGIHMRAGELGYTWSQMFGVRSMSEIKTALLTVRPPIRLKMDLLVSQVGLYFQQEYSSPLLAFPEFL
jgi:hypothetical protein